MGESMIPLMYVCTAGVAREEVLEYFAFWRTARIGGGEHNRYGANKVANSIENCYKWLVWTFFRLSTNVLTLADRAKSFARSKALYDQCNITVEHGPKRLYRLWKWVQNLVEYKIQLNLTGNLDGIEFEYESLRVQRHKSRVVSLLLSKYPTFPGVGRLLLTICWLQ